MDGCHIKRVGSDCTFFKKFFIKVNDPIVMKFRINLTIFFKKNKANDFNILLIKDREIKLQKKFNTIVIKERRI